MSKDWIEPIPTFRCQNHVEEPNKHNEVGIIAF
jgi:hypothetical protein